MWRLHARQKESSIRIVYEKYEMTYCGLESLEFGLLTLFVLYYLSFGLRSGIFKLLHSIYARVIVIRTVFKE
jgi:hypothetical protein